MYKYIYKLRKKWNKTNNKHVKPKKTLRRFHSNNNKTTTTATTTTATTATVTITTTADKKTSETIVSRRRTRCSEKMSESQSSGGGWEESLTADCGCHLEHRFATRATSATIAMLHWKMANYVMRVGTEPNRNRASLGRQLNACGKVLKLLMKISFFICGSISASTSATQSVLSWASLSLGGRHRAQPRDKRRKFRQVASSSRDNRATIRFARRTVALWRFSIVVFRFRFSAGN